MSVHNVAQVQRSLPYWLVNLRPDQWPADGKCPDFLLDVSDKDRGQLSTRDENYRWISWPEVQHLIKTNRIDLFKRLPSDLRRYLGYKAKLIKDYGSVLNFVLQERLCWTDLRPEGPPFSNSSDLKILYNDWPYGIDHDIVHLVIWTKFEFGEDPITGDLTDTAREQIDTYVHSVFDGHVDPDHIIWFKNWRSLKSVDAVEHFHVMLYKPDRQFVDRITDFDVPLADKVPVLNDV